jgi:GNAT superfamily N-acetyltransferase
MSRIYLPEYRHLWFDDGSWYMEKIYPTPIWTRSRHSQLILLFCSVSIANNWDFKIDRKYSLAEFKIESKLDRIYLDPEFHGQGIGKTLLDWTKKISSKWSFHFMVEAIDTQKKAVLFYEK